MGSSAKPKTKTTSNIVSIDPNRVQEIADRLDAEKVDTGALDSGEVVGVAYDGSLKSFSGQFSDKPYKEKLSMTLDEDDLKIAWTVHGMSTHDYIMLAVRMEGDKYPVHFVDFANRWSAENPMNGKLKELKPEQVEAAFVKMRKSDAVQYKQMSIDFTLNI